MIEINIWYALSIFWLTGYIFTMGASAIDIIQNDTGFIGSWPYIIICIVINTFFWPAILYKFIKHYGDN